ncbi:hypothetical protein HA402_004309 [Bradysia odoriphaga]|nr:hypothetical protein HA402_004309 [Bradysia odoriphaga]
MISKLIEASGRKTVYFSNLNSEILNQFVQSHKLNITVVVNDFQTISALRKSKIKATILHLESRSEFDTVFILIRLEVFSHDGHFIIFYDKADEREMEDIFSKFWKLYVYNVNVLVTKENSSNLVSMFTYMPFANGSCHNTEGVQINQYNKISANWTTNVFFPKKFKQMNRCPLRFGVYLSYPRFIVTAENGVKKISGVTFDVGTMFGDILNFTAIFIEYEEEMGVIYENKTATGLLGRVINSEVDVIVVAIQVDRMEAMSATGTLYIDKLVLVVPPAVQINPLGRVLLPFTSASWISVGMVVLLACCIIKILQFTPEAFHNYVIGRNVKGSMLNVWNVFLGGTQRILPRSNFPRFLLVKFLIFTLIMRSLYQGRVFDILKRDLRTVELKTVDEYIERNFTFYIFRTRAANLQGTKILNMSRYEVISDSAILQYCFKTLNSSFKGAVFNYMRQMMYLNLMNRRNFTFRICKEVVSMNSFVFYFTKDFYLQAEFDILLYRFDRAGLLGRIMSKYIDPSLLKDVEKQPPTALNYNSRTEFDSFFNEIRSEVFWHDGYFVIFYDTTDEREMEEIFSRFWKIHIYNVNVLATKANSSNLVSMFTYMPFDNGSCNNTNSVEINQYNKISANWTTNVFFPKKFKQLNRCPLRFGGYVSYPRFIIRTENGVKKLTGVTVDVGTMFGDKLNFTANFLEYVEDTGVVFKNKTATALVKRVMDNEVDTMVTTLQVDRMEVMSATRTLYFDQLVLVVPPPYLIDPMERVLLPFTSASWISIGLVVLLACCVIKVLQFTPKAFHNYVIGRNVKGSMLNVWNIFLGGTQQVLPRGNFPRFLLVKFLIFTLIMRSLYQGRVFDILKRDLRTVELKTIDAYNEHKFTFYIFRTLAANFQGPNIINMSRHETIIDSDILPYCFKTLNSSFKGVVFHYMRPIMYHNLMNRKNFTFRICKEVLNFNSFAFYFTKNFYLHSEFDKLLYSFDSAGLIDRIMSKYIDPNSLKQIEKQPPSSLTYSNIQEIFELFYYGCSLALHQLQASWLDNQQSCKWRENSGVFCDKRMPPKLKGKKYTTVVRPALTDGSKCWTMYEKFGRDLTTAEMKMYRMSLGVTKLDHIKSEHVRGTLHIKEAIVAKVKNERNDWFAKVHSQDESSVARKADRHPPGV